MFEGFARSAPAFFHELAVEMNKSWFDANKQRYQDEWVAPMTALVDEVAAGLARTFAPAKLATKVLRIYRDTRFAKDKQPYKTNIAAKIAYRGVSALYLHIGIDEEYLGAGTYFFDDAQLAKWRKLAAAEKTGKPLMQLVARTRKAGYRVGGYDDYKKVPRGFAPDHPRAELLRMRGLTVGFPSMPKGMLHQAKLAGWLVQHAKQSAPIVKWLGEQLPRAGE